MAYRPKWRWRLPRLAMAMTNPALRQRGQDIEIVLFDGSAAFVKGVVRNAETSAGESTQPFGDFGPIAWIDFDGDPTQIEFVEYVEPGTGARWHRRVTKRERVGTLFPVVKLHLTSVATVIEPGAPISRSKDFDPRDFAT